MSETEKNASCNMGPAPEDDGSQASASLGRQEQEGLGEPAENVTDASFDGESAQDEGRREAEREDEGSLEERVEHEALVAVFDDVRSQSSDGKLVEPGRWAEIGLVPDHMTEEEFEMFVYEYLEEYAASQEEEPEEAAPAVKTATCAVGVSRFKAPKPVEVEADCDAEATPAGEGEEPQASAPKPGVGAPVDEETAQAMAEGRFPDAVPETVTPYGEETDDEDGPFEPFEMTVGGKRGVVQLVEGEPTFVPYAPGEAPREEIDCKHIAVLVGAHSYYLYSKDRMTDNFAHWAFLSKEDSDAVTLVDCAREESRTYPRPMPASSLKNDPFFFDDERIAAALKAVEESGEFPDMETVFASNGDQYFFSTEHLSRAYAESLAEWASVERFMNV